jgi:sigma-B regulation protein RsbU (phosphoserine phosphatase)
MWLSDKEFGFCIADVSGKGMSAAILMSNFQANLRALFKGQIVLEKLVEELNERVNSSANGEKFITLFVAKYNIETHILEFINAGHNPPLLFEQTKNKLILLGSGCVGIGMLDDIPFINKGTYRVKDNTKMLCYTDGLVELLDENGIEWGTKNLEKFLSNPGKLEQNIRDIIDDRKILTGNTAIFDDISMLGIEFLPK